MAKGKPFNRLAQYIQAKAPQMGMFSTLDELVQSAPFEQAPVEEWRRYLAPGKLLEREGVQFPLKQEELDYANLGKLESTGALLDKEWLRQYIHEQRPEFRLTVGSTDKSPTGQEERKVLDSVLRGEMSSRPVPGTTLEANGLYDATHDKLYFQSPEYGDYSLAPGKGKDLDYEESLTRLRNLEGRSHFRPDVLSWSRSSQHDLGTGFSPRKARLVEEIQSDLHSQAGEKGFEDPKTGLWSSLEDTRRRAGFFHVKDLDEASRELAFGHLIPRRLGYRNPEKVAQLAKDRASANVERNARWTERNQVSYPRDPLTGSNNMDEFRAERKAALAYEEAQRKLEDIISAKAQEEGKPQDAPFKNPADYARLELRKQLLNAVNADEDALALVRGQDQIDRYGGSMDERRAAGMRYMYDEVYPSVLRKLAKQYGAEMEDVPLSVRSGEDLRTPTMQDHGWENADDVLDSLDDFNHGGGPEYWPEAADTYANLASELKAKLTALFPTQDHRSSNQDGMLKDLTDLQRRIDSHYVETRAAAQGYKEDRAEGLPEGDALSQAHQYLTHGLLSGIQKSFHALWEDYASMGHSRGVREEVKFPSMKLTPEVKERIRKAGVPVFSAAGAAALPEDDQSDTGIEELRESYAKGGLISDVLYEIVDRHTGEVIGQPYRNRKRARSQVDRLDNDYGAYRYHVREKKPDEIPNEDQGTDIEKLREDYAKGGKVREAIERLDSPEATKRLERLLDEAPGIDQAMSAQGLAATIRPKTPVAVLKAEDYLSLAPPFAHPESALDDYDYLRDIINEGELNSPPRIWWTGGKRPEGVGNIKNHEGRHRSLLLDEAGLKVPVRFIRGHSSFPDTKMPLEEMLALLKKMHTWNPQKYLITSPEYLPDWYQPPPLRDLKVEPFAKGGKVYNSDAQNLKARLFGRPKPVSHEETVERLRNLGDSQRGDPEQAMLDVQKVYGGGVLTPLVENVGDLIHRMSHHAEYDTAYPGLVRDKVEKSLDTLTYPYGFEREMGENIENNARFFGDNEPGGRSRQVDEALGQYADEHRKLPTYNRPQYFARAAAIAVGEKRWDDATRHLQSLKQLLDLGDDEFQRLALKIVKVPEGHAKGGRIKGGPPKKPVPLGKCFENSVRYIWAHPDDDLVLVHGTVQGTGGQAEGKRYGHAWVERRGDSQVHFEQDLPPDQKEKFSRTAIDVTTDERLKNPMEIPSVLYRGVGQARDVMEYDKKKMNKLLQYSKHFGPWELPDMPDESGYAEGGQVKSDIEELHDAEDYQRKLDLLRKFSQVNPKLGHMASGFTQQWAGENPETGRPEYGSKPGIIDETVALPAWLGEDMGLVNAVHDIGLASGPSAIVDPWSGTDLSWEAPTWSREAADRSVELQKKIRDEMGLSEPRGWGENMAESAGVMLGQIPTPWSWGKKAKEVGALAKATAGGWKGLGSGLEFFFPTIEPRASNYAVGTAFGGTLGALASPSEESNDDEDQRILDQMLLERMSDEAINGRRGHAKGGKIIDINNRLKQVRELNDLQKKLEQHQIDEAQNPEAMDDERWDQQHRGDNDLDSPAGITDEASQMALHQEYEDLTGEFLENADSMDPDRLSQYKELLDDMHSQITEGGLIAPGDDHTAEYMRQMRKHGMPDPFEPPEMAPKKPDLKLILEEMRQNAEEIQELKRQQRESLPDWHKPSPELRIVPKDPEEDHAKGGKIEGMVGKITELAERYGLKQSEIKEHVDQLPVPLEPEQRLQQMADAPPENPARRSFLKKAGSAVASHLLNPRIGLAELAMKGVGDAAYPPAASLHFKVKDIDQWLKDNPSIAEEYGIYPDDLADDPSIEGQFLSQFAGVGTELMNVLYAKHGFDFDADNVYVDPTKFHELEAIQSRMFDEVDDPSDEYWFGDSLREFFDIRGDDDMDEAIGMPSQALDLLRFYLKTVHGIDPKHPDDNSLPPQFRDASDADLEDEDFAKGGKVKEAMESLSDMSYGDLWRELERVIGSKLDRTPVEAELSTRGQSPVNPAHEERMRKMREAEGMALDRSLQGENGPVEEHGLNYSKKPSDR